jgi:hypothetical protein
VKKLYHIKQNGELVPVTEEVYRAYQQPKWREKKQEEVRAIKETSLDVMLESGHEIRLNLGQALVEDTVLDKLLLDELLAAKSHKKPLRVFDYTACQSAPLQTLPQQNPR